MTRWEYAQVACFYRNNVWERRTRLPGDDGSVTKSEGGADTFWFMSSAMEELGREGWELVSIVGTGVNPEYGYLDGCRLTFKRPLE